MPKQRPNPAASDDSAEAKRRTRQRYSEAFKADAVERVRSGQPVAQVARVLNVSRNTLNAWLRDSDATPLSLLEAAQSGSRKAFLIAWRDELARKIAGGVAARDMAPLGKQLNEAMRELEELAIRESEEAEDAEATPDEPLDPGDL